MASKEVSNNNILRFIVNILTYIISSLESELKLKDASKEYLIFKYKQFSYEKWQMQLRLKH